LVSAGKSPGSHDLMIAATALVHGWSVATHNERRFSRVPGLTVTAVR
jgi:predicted nucleic acid-binding protein